MLPLYVAPLVKNEACILRGFEPFCDLDLFTWALEEVGSFMNVFSSKIEICGGGNPQTTT